MGQNGAKWGKTGPNGTKRNQTGPNRSKRDQTGPNGAKRGQTGPNEDKQGQTGLIFRMQVYFYERKYQPSGAGGTLSLPATLHCLQYLTLRFIQNGQQGPDISESLGLLVPLINFHKTNFLIRSFLL